MKATRKINRKFIQMDENEKPIMTIVNTVWKLYLKIAMIRKFWYTLDMYVKGDDANMKVSDIYEEYDYRLSYYELRKYIPIHTK